jgi:hypothetical protein
MEVCMTKVFVRASVSAVVTIATYYFIYWLPMSLILRDDFGWIRSLGSLAPAITLGWYLWLQTGSPSKGFITSVVMGAFVTGGIGFSAGFFGPMIFTPGANQGPLLGIFITGPLGVLVGAVGGLVYWLRHRRRCSG